MIHKTRPIFSTQFHPEAKGGPQDSSYLFETYLESVQRYKNSQTAFMPQRNNKPSPLLVDMLAKERVGVAPTHGMAGLAAQAAMKEAASQPFIVPTSSTSAAAAVAA